MKTIAWPTPPPQPRKESPDQFLPDLELDDSDYEAATIAFQQLDDCFFEVVFVREVAARHCRERQLRAAISQKNANPTRPVAFIDRSRTPAQTTQFDSYEDWFPLCNLPKMRP
jgi:hypothetical protein